MSKLFNFVAITTGKYEIPIPYFFSLPVDILAVYPDGVMSEEDTEKLAKILRIDYTDSFGESLHVFAIPEGELKPLSWPVAPELEDFDQTQAHSEGWQIADGTEGLQIKKDSEAIVTCAWAEEFERDEDAENFVFRHAHAGSTYHLKALEIAGHKLVAIQIKEALGLEQTWEK